MKVKLLFIAAVVFFFIFLVLGGTGWAAESPVGSGRVPPSSVSSGLIRSPNPIDTSGNLIITGNVGGGKHFRGIVPYRANSAFGADLGSSSLDSFLRRSAGSGNAGRYTGTYKPYYSPSSTVSIASPGYSGVLSPTTSRPGYYATGKSTLQPSAATKGLSTTDAALQNIRFRPMSITTQEWEKMRSEQVKADPQNRKPTAEQRREWIEQLRRGLAQQQATESEKANEQAQERLKAQLLKDQPGENEQLDRFQGTQKDVWSPDVYEQMKWQIDNLRKDSEQPSASKDNEDTADNEEEDDSKDKASQERVDESSQTKNYVPDTLSGFELSARAKRILGEHKSFASFSKDKFNQHMKAAEDYLTKGKYYRAADSYTMASIYKPGDPLAYAGKSHVLFAAGEYMSSALFLSRALEIFPEYALFKIDIETMVAGRDKLESRVVDIEQWLEKSGSAELQFLLSYIYYQMGRLDRAKKAIDEAHEKMPESAAVKALKKAIYKA